MKLYKVRFEHYSQKDSREGIMCFLLAENDEAVYEALAYKQGWKDAEEDGARAAADYDPDMDDESEDGLIEVWDEETKEYSRIPFKQDIINNRGDYHKSENLSDLYYGATLVQWDEGVNIADCEIETLRELGVLEKT